MCASISYLHCHRFLPGNSTQVFCCSILSSHQTSLEIACAFVQWNSYQMIFLALMPFEHFQQARQPIRMNEINIVKRFNENIKELMPASIHSVITLHWHLLNAVDQHFFHPKYYASFPIGFVFLSSRLVSMNFHGQMRFQHF